MPWCSQNKQNPLKEKKTKRLKPYGPGLCLMSAVCFHRQWSPWRLTVRKTGGLDISLKEASSSRSVRGLHQGKRMSSACVDMQGRGGLVYTTGWGRVGPGKCEFQGWAGNWRQEPAETAVHTQNALFLQKASGWPPAGTYGMGPPDHLLCQNLF